MCHLQISLKAETGEGLGMPHLWIWFHLLPGKETLHSANWTTTTGSLSGNSTFSIHIPGSSGMNSSGNLSKFTAAHLNLLDQGRISWSLRRNSSVRGGVLQKLAKGTRKQTTAKPKSLVKCYVQLKEKKIPTPKAEGRIRNSGKG